jgi:type IV pilus assembly protein PilQ
MRTKLLSNFLGALTLGLFSVTTAMAQTPPAEPETSMDQPFDPAPPAMDATAPADAMAATAAESAPVAVPTVIIEDVTASSVARGRDTLSVDFPDEEVRNILRNVADLFELNLVIPDTLQGNTSIKLRDVTWRQIFEVVLGPVGYTFVEEGNIIKVVSQESLLQEPTTTDVFVINYARAADLLGSIQPLIDTAVGGRIVVNSRSNALIITERPSRLSRIRPIIEQLDKATDQVMIESKFIEVTDRNVKDIGVNWSSLSGYQVGVGGINRIYDLIRGN